MTESRKEKLFSKIIDIQFMGAMGPPGGARSLITQRYVGINYLVNLVPFNESSLNRIFGDNYSMVSWQVSRLLLQPFGC